MQGADYITAWRLRLLQDVALEATERVWLRRGLTRRAVSAARPYRYRNRLAKRKPKATDSAIASVPGTIKE
ncbi:hypothetical protein J3D56_001988 [Erwinia persicina]|jgi:hypothetical protein|nr:hypothetical protein [Erwinia persicina]